MKEAFSKAIEISKNKGQINNKENISDSKLKFLIYF